MITLTPDTKRLLKVLLIVVKNTTDEDGIKRVLEKGEYTQYDKKILNHFRTKYLTPLSELYRQQLDIDNSENPCGEIPLPNRYGYMRTSGKPIQFTGPITIGGTSGIHKSHIHIDYKSIMEIKKISMEQQLLQEKFKMDLELLKLQSQ